MFKDEGLSVSGNALYHARFGEIYQKPKATDRVERSIDACVPFEHEDHKNQPIFYFACRDCHLLQPGNFGALANVSHKPTCRFNKNAVIALPRRGRPPTAGYVEPVRECAWQAYVCGGRQSSEPAHTAACPFGQCKNADRYLVRSEQQDRLPAET